MARSSFPLRLSDPAVRDGVREVAALEHVSQNEYIEQAIRNDLVSRGQLRAQQLQATAARLALLSEQAHVDVLERSLTAFAEGEAGPDPLRMTALHSDSPRQAAPAAASRRVGGIVDSVAALRSS